MKRRQREAERSLHNQTNQLPKKEVIVALFSLAIPLLVAFIDQNGIGVMLPTVARDLHAEGTITWAGTTSLIANAAFQMLYGRLSDIFGRKVVYLAAITFLSIAALLCGFARDDAVFYVFRGIAGIGGGGLNNLSMIILSDVVTLQERGYYQGILGAFIGLGNVVGPFLAAAFVTHATWRAFFWTTAPLAAILGAISFYTVPSSPPTRSFEESIRKIDYGGVLLSTTGIILLLVPISGGGAYFPWASPMVISMLVLGSVSLFLFVLWEWRIAKLPMIPVQIFRSLDVFIILGQNFVLGCVYQALLYYLPLYLQNARQYSVMQSAGVIAVPVGLQSVSSVLSGRYISWSGHWKGVVSLGICLWTLGAGLMLLYRRDSSMGVIIAPLIIMGIGIGCFFQPTLTALQSHATKSRRAVIISSRNFFRCAGGSVGLTISAAILQAVLRKSLPTAYQHFTNSAYSLPEVEGPDAGPVLDAYMAGSRAVFILQVSLAGLSLLGCVFITDHGLLPLEEQTETIGSEELILGRHGLTEKTDIMDNSPKERATTAASGVDPRPSWECNSPHSTLSNI
ncbi:major facilitator superfamily domain-containing protein [Nemania sp. FL0031]|nr:major facilitator superfamily domain-containing protein [Nemania sp. FL0031]